MQSLKELCQAAIANKEQTDRHLAEAKAAVAKQQKLSQLENLADSLMEQAEAETCPYKANEILDEFDRVTAQWDELFESM